MNAAHGRLRGEDGVVSVFVVTLAFALLLVAALVFDGGRVLAVRREAHAIADNAARVGAQSVDLDQLRAGAPVRLAATEAERAALLYLEGIGESGTATVTESEVEVVVSIEVPQVLFRMIGIDTRSVTGTGRARIVRGVTGPGS